MKPYIVTVTGWRDWPWDLRRIIWTDLLSIRASLPPGRLLIIRHGKCRRGVDLIADRFAGQDPQCKPEPYPAKWYEHGPECGTEELYEQTRTNVRGAGAWCPGARQPECGRAGDRRNRLMAYAEPRADKALAYPGPPGRSGTRNAIRHLRGAGIHVETRTFAQATGRAEHRSAPQPAINPTPTGSKD